MTDREPDEIPVPEADEIPESVRDAVFAAIERGDGEGLAALLAQTPGASAARRADGLSALRLALYRGREDLALVLLDAGAPLDLFDAAAIGRTAEVDEILDRDPSLVAARSEDGFTALHLAVYFGRDEVVDLLLSRGASVGAVAENDTRVQPLHSAVAGRHAGITRRLLEAGADPNAPQAGGFTPLHAAVAAGDETLVELLLARGADPHRVTNDGRSAIDLAADLPDDAVRARIAGLLSGR
ncbi:MAG: hypothetical protein Kow0062_21940 [Acidobacteriota bacterium]